MKSQIWLNYQSIGLYGDGALDAESIGYNIWSCVAATRPLSQVMASIVCHLLKRADLEPIENLRSQGWEGIEKFD